MRLKIADLLPGTDYVVQVRAVRDGKNSKWSEKFNFSTLDEDGTPAAPTTTWAASGSSFIGTWTPVTQDTGGKAIRIDSYELEFGDGVTTKILSYVAQTAADMTCTMSRTANEALFGTAKPTVTFRVRAVSNKKTKGNWSAIKTATNAAPSTPSNFVATGIAEGVSFKWDMGTDADLARYDLHTGTTAGFTPTLANRIFSGLADAFTYNTMTYSLQYFKLLAIDEYNQASTPASASATPVSSFVVDETAPSVPTGLAVTSDRTGSVAKANLAWSFDANAAGNDDIQSFVVKWYKSGEPTKYYLDYADKASRSLSIALPQAYSDYIFQIASVDFTANYSAFSSAVTLSNAVPGPPNPISNLTGITGMDSLTLNWTPSTSGDVVNGGFYKVTIATNAGFTTGVLNYETGNPFITVSGLASNVTYYYRVIATDSTALDSTAVTGSALTDSFPVTPLSDGNAPGSSPTPMVTGGIGYLHVSWLPVTNNDMVTYEVHVSTTTGFTPVTGTKAGEQTGTSMVVENLPGGGALTYGTTYYVKIIAKDRDGAAAAGAQASAALTKGTITDLTLSAGDVGAPTTAQMTTAIANSSNGVNRTYWSTLAASGTSDGSRNYVNGDTWMQRDGSGKVIGQWEFASGAWAVRTLNHQVISSIDVGTMTILGQLTAANINATGLTISQSQIPNLTTDLSARPLATTVNGQIATAQTAAQAAAVSELKTLWGHPSNTTLIDGGDIYTNTVKASSIAIADFTNYVDDPNMDGLGQSWTPQAGSAFISVTAPNRSPGDSNLKALQVTSNAEVQSNLFNVIPGDQFYAAVYVKQGSVVPTGGNLYLRMYYRDAAGAYVAYDEKILTGVQITSSWVKHEINSTVPANARTCAFYIADYTTPVGSTTLFDTVVVRRRNGGELLIDGTVSANKMTAGTYTGGEFIIGAGGILKTAGSEVIITSSGISVSGTGSSINAAALTTGSTITGNLGVTGNMTISSSGTIKSTNYDPGVAGFSLGASGLDIRTGTVAVGTLTSGTISSKTITLGAGGAMIVDSTAVIKSNNWTPGSQGWQLSSTGLTVYGLDAYLDISRISGDTIAGRNLTVYSGGSIKSSDYNPGFAMGWQLSSSGLTIYNGVIYGASIETNQLKSFGNSTLSSTGRSFAILADGKAEFADARIYGNTSLGSGVDNYVQSGNFISGSVGWKLFGNGDAEVANLKVYGNTMVGSSTAHGIQTWNYAQNQAGWRMDGAGNVNFNQATVTGGVLQTGTGTVGVIRIDGSGLKSWDSAGRNIVTIDGSTEMGVRGTLRVLPLTSGGAGALIANSNVDVTFNGPTSMLGGATINNGLTVNTGNVTLSGSGADVTIPSIAATGSNNTGVANSHYIVAGPGGKLYRGNVAWAAGGSSIKIKQDLIPLDELVTAKQIVSLEPYRFKYIKYPDLEQVGFMAEYAEALGLKRWVVYNEKGEVEDFDYQKFGTAQQIVLRDHDRRVEHLETKVNTLEQEVAELRSLVESLLGA